MQQPIRKLLYLAGLISPLWLAASLIVTGSLYAGYSHIDQAMGLLGAIDAPTHALWAWLGHYPLGLLSIAFGIGLYAGHAHLRLARLSASLIIVHGVASLAAGYFTCDAGCSLQYPSTQQNLHTIASVIMSASLLLASALWIVVARREGRKGLVWLSLICSLFALGCLPWMAAAMDVGRGFGLFQRVNYFASLVWVAGLAWALLKAERNEYA
ncbi:hypothetical protein AHFPHNDE_03221 [Pseudomonas sp. MM227]|uniref:DUF998 domain-containing protein n=1 Tax=unclassified Pseudomonas TaxID=196821 RepID=UPI000F0182D8|nr:DUF998 domain-containing protein [Pseudomonas sp. MM227]MBD8605096.1 DUF998 domain-containing protein [Pseudomonas sp. CFBP 8771]MBD8623854.1 DUF998 domain-containing protein [Pseudomonas sp. CFBP 13727]MBD8731227.1 DUF998 domain-containing protein [Pseudomonas sp. CFBP 13710]MBD8826128.1 DUF998 domain-containing protein [Pseudomonas sp. CFBP 13602]CAI3789518.1 hypothetical protein AHFPHNDE_03221 [Pseudomonas sp. MM227]